MKELIKALLVCVFMVNMVYVCEQSRKTEAAKYESKVMARYAKNRAARRAFYKAAMEHEINKHDVLEPVLASY